MEEVYLMLGKRILGESHLKEDRAGAGTYSLFSYRVRLDLAKGLPPLTARQIPFGLIKNELLWFLKSDTSIRHLSERNSHIWDEWAFGHYVESADYQEPDVTDFGHRVLQDPAFAGQYKEEHQKFRDAILNDAEFAEKYGELGNIYSTQWRHWETKGGSFIGQLANVTEMIKTSPNSRRLIVSIQNPEDAPSMTLPPYRTIFQFYVSEGKLSYQLYQCSADVFLGVPFNIAGYALLTHLIAHETGLEVGEFVHTLRDAHLYQSHVEQMQERLSREVRSFLTLISNPDKVSVFNSDMEDIKVEGYDLHPTIRVPIAV